MDDKSLEGEFLNIIESSANLFSTISAYLFIINVGSIYFYDVFSSCYKYSLISHLQDIECLYVSSGAIQFVF